jgi:hypothetical protein
LASAAITVASTAGVLPGMVVSGTNVPAGARVLSVDSATQLTLDTMATAAGTGITFTVGQPLVLTGDVVATSANPGTVASLSGNVDLNGADRILNVAPVTIFGKTNVAPYTPTLNISATMIDSGAVGGLVKTGAGLVQLTGANTFPEACG